MTENIKIKIIAIAKDEAAYIPQWIHHHFHFGFDAVEIWINNSSDNSIALMQKLQETYGEDVIVYEDADKFLSECQKQGRHFQPDAYNAAYKREAQRGLYTHLMFLDLDELWTPSNFRDSVKDLIARYPDSDVISTMWMVDMPDHDRQPFTRPFSGNDRFQKNRHVKSIVKISPKVKRVDIHTSEVIDGVLHLADGSVFEDAPDARKANWAYMALDQFRKRMQDIDEYFIVHQIYRSQQEYLSSLLRGRGHALDDNLFKVNRVGYLPIQGDNPAIKFCPTQDLIDQYNQSYNNFIAKNNLAPLIESATEFIMARYHNASKLLKTNPALNIRYRTQIRGLDIATPEFDGIEISGCIESTLKNTTNQIIEIKGWATDFKSEQALQFQLTSSRKNSIDLLAQKIFRPDVYTIIPKLGLNCGFRLEIPLSLLQRSSTRNTPMLIVRRPDKSATLELALHQHLIFSSRYRKKSLDLPASAIGEITKATIDGFNLVFQGSISAPQKAGIDIYFLINDIYFTSPVLRVRWLPIEASEMGDDNRRFEASLSLFQIPEAFRDLTPNFYATIDGHMTPLEVTDTCHFPSIKDVETAERGLFPPSLRSSIPIDELLHLQSDLKGATTYLAFGEVTTVTLALKQHVKNVVIADSRQSALETLRKKIGSEFSRNDLKLYPIHLDIGKVDNFGYSSDEKSNWKKYASYLISPWDFLEDNKISPDVTLVSGRFRIASFLTSLIMSKSGAIIYFNDYTSRKAYQAVESVIKPTNLGEKLAKFVVPESINVQLATKLLLKFSSHTL